MTSKGKQMRPASKELAERLNLAVAALDYDSLRSFWLHGLRAVDSISYEAVRNYHNTNKPRDPGASYLLLLVERFGVNPAFLLAGQKPVLLTGDGDPAPPGVSDLLDALSAVSREIAALELNLEWSPNNVDRGWGSMTGMGESRSVLVQRVLSDAVFSLRQLADDGKMSYGVVRSWANGFRTPRPDNMRLIADVLRSRADRLLLLADEIDKAAAVASDRDGEFGDTE